MSILERSSASIRRPPVGELRGVPYYSICYTGFPLQELDAPDPDYSVDRTKALTRLCKDGVKPMTKEEQSFERDLNWKLIKAFTMSIFKMDVTRFSFPVGYSETRTFMERAADLFSFLVSDFLERAYATDSRPIRAALTAIGVIASFHLYLQAKKPWNPVIGETYIGRWASGPTMYAEQTSHHPPVTSVQIRTPTGHWKIDANFCFGIDQGIFQIDVLQKGRTTLQFSDGCTYEWEYPTIRAVGLLRGDRIVRVKGPFHLKDLTNRLEVKVKVAPKASKARGIVKPQATTVWGGVRAEGAPKDVFLAKITGDYAGVVCLDGVGVWSLETDFAVRPCVKVDDDELLLSDCRFRIDRAMLIQGDMEAAEHAKGLLEELQRCDAKLRGTVGGKH